MKLIWALCILGSLFIQGCVQSTTEGHRSLIDQIEPAQLDLSKTSRLPLFYRHTSSDINSVEQVMADGALWQNVSGFPDGHSTQPSPGYHWYAIKVQGEQLRDLGWFLAIESKWWTDIGAWSINTSKQGESEQRSLVRMKMLGLRYRLTAPADSTSTIFLRFRVLGRTLSRAEYFLSHRNTLFIEQVPVLLGCFLGGLLLVLIYNVGYFILVREVSYFYFGFTILGVAGLVAAELGAWDFLGLPFTTELTSWASFATFFCGLMVGRITSSGDSPGKSQRLLNVLLVASLIVWGLWQIFNWSPFFTLLNVIHFSIGMTSLFVTSLSWRRGEALMGTFFFSLLPACLLLGYVPFMRAGLLPNFFGNDYFNLVGAVIFLALISSLLPLRFQRESLSRDILGRSLLDKEERLSEIDGEVKNIAKVLEALREEDNTIRASLTATQKSRIDTEKGLRNAHHQLRHLEYHVSLGRLVAGLAHDIANPATHISGCAQNFESMINKLKMSDNNLLGDLKGFRRLESAGEELSLQSAYIVRVNQALARYGRIDDSASSEVDLALVVEQVLCVIASRVSLHDVVCRFDKVPRLTAKPGQMSQMLANLILNAADAIVSHTDKGEILVTVEPARQDECDGIFLSVEDSGPGIPDMIRRAGFRAFVTTRDPARWLGIGLSIVKRIIDEHGGELSFPPARELSGGAVRVWLPLSQSHEA